MHPRAALVFSISLLLGVPAAARRGPSPGQGEGERLSTPRIPRVAEQDWTEAQRSIAMRFGVGGHVDNDLATYLVHPVLAGNIMPFERYISNESTLSPRHREILILRTARLCRSEYV